MGLYDFSHCLELLRRESPWGQQFPCACNGIGNMIPARQLCGVLRSVSHEDAQIVKPCSGKHDVVVVVEAIRNRPCQGIEPRLMPELVDWPGLRTDVLHHGLAPLRRHQEAPPGHLGEMRIKSKPPISCTAKMGDIAGTATIPRSGNSTPPNPGLVRRADPAAAKR